MKKIAFGGFRQSVWSKVAASTAVLFFILLADGILSDWVPNYMQNVFGSPVLMGLVMSFSSLIGFGADLIFPQILKGTTVKKLILAAVITGGAFSASLFVSLARPYILIFLAAMAVWGLYYEFLGFANQQFVAETVAANRRSQVWAVMGVFRSLAYFLGPILGGYLMTVGNKSVVVTAAALTLFSYFLLYLIKVPDRKLNVENEKINLGREIAHWWVLLEHVWPVLIISLMLGLVDATFWTTGTVLTENLAKQNWWGGMFLPMYILPSLFVGFAVLKWGIYKGKKKWAEFFMLLGGVFLTGLAVSGQVYWQLLMVFLSSVALSVTYPLIDAVYSDISVRMGRESKHMMGLSSSMISLSYIVGPAAAGLIAEQVGERATFVSMGAAVTVMAIFLLIVTPRKLRLPQQEIATWQ